jgi:inner membrane protein
MQWWGWIAVGVVLLGSELAFVDAQFYLVFIGGAAMLVGLLVVSGLPLALWLQWLIFIVLAVVFLQGFRSRIYRRLRTRLPVMQDGLSGEVVKVPVDLRAGDECRLEYRGSTWNAVNAGNAPISAGSPARIERVEGLTLHLQAKI